MLMVNLTVIYDEFDLFGFENHSIKAEKRECQRCTIQECSIPSSGKHEVDQSWTGAHQEAQR